MIFVPRPYLGGVFQFCSAPSALRKGPYTGSKGGPEAWVAALLRYEGDEAMRLRDAGRLLKLVRKQWVLEDRGYLRRLRSAWTGD